MLKKLLSLACVVALSAAFVGCEPAPVVDTPPVDDAAVPAADVTTPADTAVVPEDAPAPAAEEPATGTN